MNIQNKINQRHLRALDKLQIPSPSEREYRLNLIAHIVKRDHIELCDDCGTPLPEKYGTITCRGCGTTYSI